MIQTFIRAIGFILKSLRFYIPLLSRYWDKLIAFQQRLLFYVIFKGNEEGVYALNTRRKLILNRHSYLAKLLINDFEFEELAFVRALLRRGDFVLDVGANVGVYSLLSSDYIGHQGKVYAFEPVPDTCAELRKNVALNHLSNVSIHALAVSDMSREDLKIHTHPSGYDVFDSALTIPENAKVVTVKTITIDDFVEVHAVDISRLSLVKIDTEGWEINVLRGAVKLVEAGLSVAFLVEFAAAKEASSSARNKLVYDFMCERGYQWYWYDVSTGKLLLVVSCQFEKECNRIAVNAAFKQKKSYLFN